MSIIQLSVLRRHAIDGTRRTRRVVPLVTAAALSVSVIAAAADPAGAARQPARTAPISLASSVSALPAASLAAVARYVHASDGRLTLDTIDAQRAGAGSQALSTESALVANLNQVLGRDTATANSARGGIPIGVAKAIPAAAQDTTVTILPGITLTISNTEIQLSMTKQAVTEVENLAGFGQSVASLVGAILNISQVASIGGQITAIVASSLGLGSSLLKLCTAPDGSATFTIPFFGLPSCSGLNLLS